MNADLPDAQHTASTWLLPSGAFTGSKQGAQSLPRWSLALRSGFTATAILLALVLAADIGAFTPEDIHAAQAGRDDEIHQTLLWRHAATGQNFAWFMNGSTVVTGEALLPVADPKWVLKR